MDIRILVLDKKTGKYNHVFVQRLHEKYAFSYIDDDKIFLLKEKGYVLFEQKAKRMNIVMKNINAQMHNYCVIYLD